MEFKSIHHITDHGLALDKKLPPKKLGLLIAGLLTGFVLLTGLVVLVFFWIGGSPSVTLQQQIKSADVAFPVYFPKDLPNGFVVSPDAAEVKKDVVVYSLQKGDSKVIVNQQARPPIMEELVKTKEVSISFGTAYIANLNGRAAGVIVTDKTLVIISSSKDLAADQLEALLKSMAAL